MNACAVSGTLAGKGGNEVTDLIEQFHEVGGELMELKDVELPKQIEAMIYLGTFTSRFENNYQYCSIVCNMQSFQRESIDWD